MLRAMTPSDLDGALPLSQAVGWPYRREDWSGTRPPATGPERIHGLASQSFG